MQLEVWRALRAEKGEAPLLTQSGCMSACVGLCNITYDASIIHSCFLISSFPLPQGDPQEPLFPWHHLQ